MEDLETRARARGFRTVAGVDEAGRGPLAGPVMAAAVVLPPGFKSPEIRDSKALSPKARERAFFLVTSNALSFAVAHSTHEEIDRENILRASLLAMRRAVEKLDPVPDFLYVDGHLPIPGGADGPWRTIRQEPLVSGDSRCVSVMAASILAKVTRDRLMLEYDRVYPGYGFASHKGYPTKAHLAALAVLGPSPIHRRTFRGVLPG
ncbi:MAG: ribonuclease HII [Deltaproteobacteria bacterium]|nr:MAG: ribonuclease HII [Deltaproteobacteria bacterium]